MTWVQHMRKALEDRRQPVLRGIVEAVDGRVVQVRVPDGRLIPAAPLALVGGGKGVYQRYATGDDVVLLCDQGDPNGAVCLASPRTEGQDAPGEVDHEGMYIYEDRVEIRAAEGDDVQGVVMRPVLDGIYSALGAVSDLLDVLASPITPPGSAVQNAALLTAVRTQIGLPAVGTSAVLSNVLGDLDTSRAGQGTGPYCSDVLRAVVDGPGGGGGGGASPGATLEDIDDAIQAHLTADHANLATDADIAALDARVDALESGGAGVISVNGESGVVILSAADVGADASGTASGLLASHVAAGDPHTGYVLETREGAANGIATLNGSTLVPRAQLGTGASGFLTYGGTWAVLVAGDVPDLSATYATAGHNHAGTYQPLDADLTALAATSSTDGHTWRRSGGTWAYGTLDHTVLGSLAWTSSGHTGADGTLAGWSGGVPVEVSTSTFASASHVHAAGDITSGTLATARLGTGTATGAVLVGGAWVAGSGSGEILRWSGSAWAASALSAADITTGAVSVAARLGWLPTTTTASTTDATNGTTTNTPSWSVTTGKTYMVEMIGTFDCAAGTSGFRVRLEESGGASSSVCAGQVWYSHASGIAAEPITAAGTWTSAGTGSTSRAGIKLEVTYVCTGTGTLKLGIRPETAASNVNLYAKTIYRLLEI